MNPCTTATLLCIKVGCIQMFQTDYEHHPRQAQLQPFLCATSTRLIWDSLLSDGTICWSPTTSCTNYKVSKRLWLSFKLLYYRAARLITYRTRLRSSWRCQSATSLLVLYYNFVRLVSCVQLPHDPRTYFWYCIVQSYTNILLVTNFWLSKINLICLLCS